MLVLLFDFMIAYKNFSYTYVNFHYERAHIQNRIPCTWSKKIESLFTLRWHTLNQNPKAHSSRRANACARLSSDLHLFHISFRSNSNSFVCVSFSSEQTQSVCRLVQLQNRKPTEKINRVQKKADFFFFGTNESNADTTKINNEKISLNP